MKKIYILIFAVLMVLLSGCQTANTVYFDESESIKQADSFWYTTAIVSNSGNCYVTLHYYGYNLSSPINTIDWDFELSPHKINLKCENTDIDIINGVTKDSRWYINGISSMLGMALSDFRIRSLSSIYDAVLILSGM